VNVLLERLSSAAPVVTDGAWGTQLFARGLDVGQCPDAWNLTHPAQVEEVARAYVDAGSQIILTNTFGASCVRLAEYGLADRTTEINRTGAQISKRAAGSRALVFASIGPTGKMLLTEEISRDEMRAAFAEQARALRDGGADGIVVETMADLEEARLALEAAKETGLPVVVCMTFDTGGRTMMGVTPEQAARELSAAGADVIGSNCGNGIAELIPITRQLRAATTLPLWLKPNAGMPEMVSGKPVWRTSPADFARHVPALLEAGATFVGGCCGTTPAHIAELVRR